MSERPKRSAPPSGFAIAAHLCTRSSHSSRRTPVAPVGEHHRVPLVLRRREQLVERQIDAVEVPFTRTSNQSMPVATLIERARAAPRAPVELHAEARGHEGAERPGEARPREAVPPAVLRAPLPHEGRRELCARRLLGLRVAHEEALAAPVDDEPPRLGEQHVDAVVRRPPVNTTAFPAASA